MPTSPRHTSILERQTFQHRFRCFLGSFLFVFSSFPHAFWGWERLVFADWFNEHNPGFQQKSFTYLVKFFFASKWKHVWEKTNAWLVPCFFFPIHYLLLDRKKCIQRLWLCPQVRGKKNMWTSDLRQTTACCGGGGKNHQNGPIPPFPQRTFPGFRRFKNLFCSW